MQDHITQFRPGLAPGANTVLDRASDPDVGISFVVVKLGAGEEHVFEEPGTERAVLILSGNGAIEIAGADGVAQALPFARKDWLEQGPAAAHASTATRIAVRAETPTEIA